MRFSKNVEIVFYEIVKFKRRYWKLAHTTSALPVGHVIKLFTPRMKTDNILWYIWLLSCYHIQRLVVKEYIYILYTTQKRRWANSINSPYYTLSIPPFASRHIVLYRTTVAKSAALQTSRDRGASFVLPFGSIRAEPTLYVH